MKISSTINNTPGRGIIMPEAKKRERVCEQEREHLKHKRNENINTSIESNPDARVSFRGTEAPLLHKAAHFVSDKPLVAEAIFAILITCGLRPVSIMATASNEEEEEKCRYQAAKSILTGVVGLAFSALIGTPIGNATKKSNEEHVFDMPSDMRKASEEVINKGVGELKQIKEKSSDNELNKQIEKITKHGNIDVEEIKSFGKDGIKTFKEKIGKNGADSLKLVENAIAEQVDVNNYKKAAKNVADKLFQPIAMPIRAALTIALIPPLLAFANVKKSGNKEIKQEESPIQMNTLNVDVFEDKKTKELFKSFVGSKE